MNIEETIAAARAELEAWRDAQLTRIHAARDAQMASLLAQARADMEEALARALANYREGLERIQQQRETHRKRMARLDAEPAIASGMERVYTRTEESLTRNYETQVDLIKTMYRKGLGIE